MSMPYPKNILHCLNPDCTGHLLKYIIDIIEVSPKITYDPIYICSECSRLYYPGDLEIRGSG